LIGVSGTDVGTEGKLMNKVRQGALAVATSIGVAVLLAGQPAQAQRRKPVPTPTTTIAPAPPASVPAPTSASVVVVPANTYAYQPTSLFFVQVSPSTQLGDAELTSGPATVTPYVSDNGRVSFYGPVVAGTRYTFRYRNKVWSAASGTFSFSPWVSFAFVAPTLP
jgi:hypothetical protein